MEMYDSYIRVKYSDRKKWVKISGDKLTKNLIDVAVKQSFNLNPTDNIEYYDESRFDIGNILADFIRFSPCGVTVEVKLQNEEFEELRLVETPVSHLSTASTASLTSGASDLPISLILQQPPLSPVPEVYKACGNVEEFQKVLMARTDGRELLNEYNSNKELSTASRKKLTNIVVSLMIEKYGNYPNKDIKIKYAKEIIHLFKCYENNEGTGYELLFNPENRTGFLETRLRTINRSNPQPKKLKLTSEKPESTVQSLENEVDNVNDCIQYLNTACVKNDRELIYDYMVKTFNHRQNIEDILNIYPRFKDTPGLITLDFRLKFKSFGTIRENFPKYIEKVFNIYRSETHKEPPKDWDSNTNAILTLLHLLPPSARGRGGAKKKSITDDYYQAYEIQDCKEKVILDLSKLKYFPVFESHSPFGVNKYYISSKYDLV